MQKKSIFIYFYSARNGQRGQIAAFLILVMVIILVAAIALIQVGRVSQDKLNTANAADAAALAGASMIASSANMLCDMNRILEQSYFIQLAILAWPINLETHADMVPTRFYMWLSAATLAMLVFAGELISSVQAMSQAQGSAHQYAFNNVGIDEAPRKSKGTPMPIKQPFSEWMEDQKMSERQNAGSLEKTFTYSGYPEGSWHEYTFNPATAKQEPAGLNSVSSTTELGDCGIALKPAAFNPLVANYYFELPPCDPVEGCGACMLVYAVVVYGALMEMFAEMAISYAAFAGFSLPMIPLVGDPKLCPAIRQSVSLFMINVALPHVWMIPSPPICGLGADIAFFYNAPFVYMEKILNENKLWIKTEVTRNSPERKVGGLWNMQPISVTSSAKGRVKNTCGTWNPFDYDAVCYDLGLESAQ
ncbi:MAG: pilus assembly protein TadG-related protein [Candidatus Omnitrophica bacterium]|nr:pilus assembly protein TadG-related protein [Candidatus Omnitrophota bacterium]MDD5236185.1 pilus assembly protein TadG-related protein [Candidatus Omnitrophota bacterium]MDD5610828.1 pilus assembly protein TadG-related protein [Candidatus Omnitrophota bacterium]